MRAVPTALDPEPPRIDARAEPGILLCPDGRSMYLPGLTHPLNPQTPQLGDFLDRVVISLGAYFQRESGGIAGSFTFEPLPFHRRFGVMHVATTYELRRDSAKGDGVTCEGALHVFPTEASAVRFPVSPTRHWNALLYALGFEMVPTEPSVQAPPSPLCFVVVLESAIVSASATHSLRCVLYDPVAMLRRDTAYWLLTTLLNLYTSFSHVGRHGAAVDMVMVFLETRGHFPPWMQGELAATVRPL